MFGQDDKDQQGPDHARLVLRDVGQGPIPLRRVRMTKIDRPTTHQIALNLRRCSPAEETSEYIELEPCAMSAANDPRRAA